MGQSLDKLLASEKEESKLDQQRLNSLTKLVTNETDKIVLKALVDGQPATRMQLCERTGIPRTTIYDALTRLILKKVVIKYSNPNKTKGRPKVFYRVA
ncbi:MAG: hypothetical protein JSV04_13550 [Candidatus Heimdallarchaeota archaeon]|nr:MAG: hypothetical protein JSV04_13550 [Candidatus Heimdallarchaeota archaeon]